MKYQKVIFIDPGTNFGWAVMDRCGKKSYTSGVVTLPKESGPRVVEFWEWLEDNILGAKAATSLTLTFLAWEEAAWGGYGTAMRMYGMWEGLLIKFCEDHEISYCTVNGSTLKSYIRKQGFYLPPPRRPSKPKKGATKKAQDAYKALLEKWNAAKKGFDVKPRPRPEWPLTSKEKLQNNETDARWGLEYVLIEHLEEEN